MDWLKDVPEIKQPPCSSGPPVLLPHHTQYCFPRHWTQVEQWLRPIATGQNCYWEDAIEALEAIIGLGRLIPTRTPDLSVLYEFIKRDVAEEYERLLPWLAQWALAVPRLFPQKLQKLSSRVNGYIALSREQVRCLLALMFWCAFPLPTAHNTYKTPANTMLSVFGRPKAGREGAQLAKLHCILQYFLQSTAPIDSDCLFFRRVVQRIILPGDPLPFHKVTIVSGPSSHVESYSNSIQIDFADKQFGGGVLSSGSAQEECMLAAYVEPIVGLLFVDQLQDEEVVIISGIRLYNQYEGFSGSLRWQQGVVESVDGRVIVAVDAEDYRKREQDQYQSHSITRELNKAVLGFGSTLAPENYEVVTGNWGCGVFKGDIQLKFLIQWLAASLCGRNLTYLTWDNSDLANLDQWVLFFSQYASNQVLKALSKLKPPGMKVFEQVRNLLGQERGQCRSY